MAHALLPGRRSPPQLSAPALASPTIVRFIGHFAFRNHLCVAMTLMGRSLQDLMRARGVRGLGPTQRSDKPGSLCPRP